MKKSAFIQLVEKYLAGKANPAEEELLVAYYRQLEAKGKTVLSPEEEDALRSKLLRKIRSKAGKRFPVMIPIGGVGWLGAAAAMLILALVGAGFWLNSQYKRESPSVVTKREPIKDIAPGGNKAVLTLANGVTVVLDKEEIGVLKNAGNARVLKPADGELKYLPLKDHEQRPVVYNTLSVPKGGQYKLILPDGTRVWLNAASSVSYPTAFTGSSREIELQGEAYFEVAKNEAKPFLIKIPGDSPGNPTEVKVLGTHFNVKAYQNERAIKTTLLEGSVQLSKGKEKVLLHPGEQAQVDNAGIRLVDNVNTDEAIAWKNGNFQFNDTDLKSIMMQLERWYDVQINYDDIPELHFSGTISRNTYLSEVLDMLEVTSNIKFELINGQLKLKEK